MKYIKRIVILDIIAILLLSFFSSNVYASNGSYIGGIEQKNGWSGTMMVVKNDKTVYLKSFGYANYKKDKKNTNTTSYQIDSIQKSLTAGLVMQQVDKKKLKLNQKLSDFYPQIEGSNKITILQMLEMTSGLRFDEDNESKQIMSEQDTALYLANNTTFNSKTYKKWAYTPINYNLLAGILMKVTHKSYSELFTKEYIKKLKLKHTKFAYDNGKKIRVAGGYTNSDHEDKTVNYKSPFVVQKYEYHNELGTGQVYMSVEDLYKAEKYITSGKFLTPKSRQKLYSPSQVSSYSGGFYNRKNDHYANGWGYGYQGVIHLTDDSKSFAILLSNYQRDAYDLKPYVQKIFSTIILEKEN
ncbi:serine hydrolase domain-containing protein [Lactobacillus terrae]|uniref:serine hydrolase domain-containing protein n=1 Tax=Lactobacillus terrae TaxID=2269374 RepID=UPI000C1B6362|nr:serine hydrolase domain-containing protein [Lactobacillus terrae]